MVKLLVFPQEVHVKGASSKIKRLIRKECSLFMPSAYYSEAYRKGWWDGRRYFYKKDEDTFPRGLLGMVKRFLDEQGVEYKIRHQFQEDPFKEVVKSNGWKLDKSFQIPALERCLKKKVGIVKLPTGSGKTIVMGFLVLSLNRKTVVVVPDKNLLYQSKDKIGSIVGEKKIGLIGDGHFDLNKEFTVIIPDTIQSIFRTKKRKNETNESRSARRKKRKKLVEFFKDVKLSIYDECHDILNDKYNPIMRNVKEIQRVYGFSATPLDRESDYENMTIVSKMGEIIFERTLSDLIRLGWLAKPYVYFIEVNNDELVVPPQSMKEDKADEGLRGWKYVYDHLIAGNEKRNNIVAKLIKRHKDERVLILTKRIEHGEYLSKLFGVPFLSGRDDEWRRFRTIENFESKKITKLIASTIFDQGIDIVNIEVLINCSGGNSFIKLFQRLGRGTRRSEEKDKLIAYDFIDTGHEYTESHSLFRMEELESEKEIFVDVLDEI